MAVSCGLGSLRIADTSDYYMVAAIDFGTTFSGYAFSFKSNKTDIKMNRNWGAAVGFEAYKTPTCVLLDPRGDFKSFGFDAEREYASLMEGEDKEFQLYDRFKMKLHKEKNLGVNTEIESRAGEKAKAIDIFAKALKFLKEHLVSAISQMFHGPPEHDLIRWVITVPAIWSDGSKQFMRKAAYMAGLIGKESSDKLLIALEPEAASMYCRSLEINQFLAASDVADPDITVTAGTKYVVIDSGGGTIDITAHQVQPNEDVRELYRATGGAWGGTKIDEQFVTELKVILGDTFIDSFRENSPSQWLALMLDFEKKKRGVKPKDTGTLNIQLSWAMGSAYQEFYGDSIEDAISRSGRSGFTFSNGMLCLSKTVVQRIFKSTLDDIVDHLKTLLQEQKLRDIGFIFMVGGFSDSGYLQKVIKDEFGSRAQVLIPDGAGFAVMNGAVMFGHRPQAIRSRVAHRTYGMQVYRNFDPNKHDQAKKVDCEGRVQCKDLFDIFVKKNEEVNLYEQREFTCNPVYANQTGATIQLYSVEKDYAKYVTETGVDKVGSIYIKFPDDGLGLKRVIKVYVIFGGTEMQVMAKDESAPDGDFAETNLNFLTS